MKQASGTRPDWYGIYRRLMFGKGRYRTWEIERMTEPEIIMALDDDLESVRPPTGMTVHASRTEQQAHHERRRTMTPADRLREARGW